MTHDLETAIDRAIAAKRRSSAPSNVALAGHKPGDYRAGPVRKQTRQAAHAGLVMATGYRGSGGFDPWPQRPRFSSRIKSVSASVRRIAVMPVVVALSAVIFSAGLYRAATYQDNPDSWPMVTHLFWRM